MYSERAQCRKIKNQLNYSIAHLKKALEKLLQKCAPQDVYCQLRAAEGGINKINNTLLKEALITDLAVRINRLQDTKPLSAESAETLAGIQKKMHKVQTKQLLKLELLVRGIEGLYFFFLFLDINFLEPLLQNSPLWFL